MQWLLNLFALQAPIVGLILVAGFSMAGAAALEVALRFRQRALFARAELIAPRVDANPITIAAGIEAPLQSRVHSVDLGPTEPIVAWLLRRFRIPHRFSGLIYVGLRPFTSIVLTVAVWFFGPVLLPFTAGTLMHIAATAAGGLFGWFLPVLVANWRARHYRQAVVAGLPDALELLVICSEGGLSLADGIERIVDELRTAQPELADELAQTSADLKLLPTQDEALARLAQRVDVPIVRSVVTSLAQTLRFGTPLAMAMRSVAADLRNQALVKMEERVNRLPALLSIPMIVFILPTIILISGGPAALETFDLMTR